MGFKEKWDLYTSLLSNYISNGELINRDSLSSLGIKPLYGRIATKTNIKRVFCITQFPIDFDLCLEAVLNAKAKEVDPLAKVYTNSYSVPTTLNVNTKIFKDNMAAAEAAYEQYSSMFDDLSKTEKATGRKVSLGGGVHFFITKAQLKKIKGNHLSHQYIHEAVSEGCGLSNTFFFVEVICTKNSSLKRVSKEITRFLDEREFSYFPLTSNVSYYLSNFSPASYLKEFTNKEFVDLLMTDENLTHTIPTKTHGFIGNGSGTKIAFDVRAQAPFILNFFEGGGRQVVLMSGGSGTGKTVLSQMACASLMFDGVHCLIIDVKGDEWPKMEQICEGVLVVDISEQSTSFVNTLRLDDIEIESVEDGLAFYNMAKTATVELFKLLIQPKSDNESMVSSMLNLCVEKIFTNNNVNPNLPSTYKYTKVLKYDMILDNLEALKQSPTYSKYIDLIDDMKIKLESQLRHSNLFRGKEIVLSDIIKSKCVVATLNKNDNQIQTIEDSIRSLMKDRKDLFKVLEKMLQRETTIKQAILDGTLKPVINPKKLSIFV